MWSLKNTVTSSKTPERIYCTIRRVLFWSASRVECSAAESEWIRRAHWLSRMLRWQNQRVTPIANASDSRHIACGDDTATAARWTRALNCGTGSPFYCIGSLIDRSLENMWCSADAKPQSSKWSGTPHSNAAADFSLLTCRRANIKVLNPHDSIAHWFFACNTRIESLA